mmetsp:Transcript_65709/g.137353  ORF Transcript_65709/g.137353 Transcript_65709/m.137353 type:complete len:288 (-) Transcript_65709:1233-2096(-)
MPGGTCSEQTDYKSKNKNKLPSHGTSREKSSVLLCMYELWESERSDIEDITLHQNQNQSQKRPFTSFEFTFTSGPSPGKIIRSQGVCKGSKESSKSKPKSSKPSPSRVNSTKAPSPTGGIAGGWRGDSTGEAALEARGEISFSASASNSLILAAEIEFLLAGADVCPGLASLTTYIAPLFSRFLIFRRSASTSASVSPTKTTKPGDVDKLLVGVTRSPSSTKVRMEAKVGRARSHSPETYSMDIVKIPPTGHCRSTCSAHFLRVYGDFEPALISERCRFIMPPSASV